MCTSIFQTEDDPDYDNDNDKELTALRLRAMSRNPPVAFQRSSGRKTALGGASSSSGTTTTPEQAAAANNQQAGDPWSWPDALVPGLVTQAMPPDECWGKVVLFLQQQLPITTHAPTMLSQPAVPPTWHSNSSRHNADTIKSMPRTKFANRQTKITGGR